LRDFLDAILAFIGVASLSDEEFEGLTLTDEEDGYNQATYIALSEVLVSRDAISTSKDRLTYFFKSKGVEVSDSVSTAISNIYIGDALC